MTVTKPKMGTLINKQLSISQGLVGSWIFNEGSSTVVYDSSGGGVNGNFAGTTPPTWTTGQYGSAINFPIQSADGSILTTALPANLSIPFTYVFSVTPIHNAALTSYYYVVSGGTLRGLAEAYGTQLTIYNTAGPIGSAMELIKINTPYLFIVGVQADGKCYSYSNGTPINTGQNAGTAALSTSLRFGNAAAGGSCADAVMDFVMVWNRVLSASEAALLSANPFAPYANTQTFFKVT